MILRKAEIDDINRIMEIIKQAQDYLKQMGIDQWQNNYPNIDNIASDIERGEGYVLLSENQIIATVAVSFNGEKTYDRIYEGHWLTNNEYGVIHRIAVENSHKGKKISSSIISFIERLCLERNVYSLKVDTHEENESMKKMLLNNGFKYCGVIYLESGSKRVAYEKILDKDGVNYD